MLLVVEPPRIYKMLPLIPKRGNNHHVFLFFTLQSDHCLPGQCVMCSLVRDRLQSDHVKDSLPGQRPCDVAENHKSSNDILEIMQNICRDIKFQLIMDPRNNIIKVVFEKAKLYSPELATPSRIVAAICHFYLVKLLHSTDEKNAHDGCNYFNGTSQEEILPI